MRNVASFLTLALAVPLAGCSPSLSLPSVEPEAVEVFYPGSAPAEDYKVLARIDEEAPIDADYQELVERAQARAAKLGADALIISSIRTNTEGTVSTNLDFEPKKIIEALAVYFPSRHPS